MRNGRQSIPGEEDRKNGSSKRGRDEEKQQAIEWLKGRPITMPGAKKMFALAIEALEAYVPDKNVGKTETSCESNTEITRCSYDTISRQVAIDALVGKDINVPNKSALDHIHNVVRDDAYRRGYEQGKADAVPKWIPIKAHPATEEEQESRPDIDYWFDCEMPEDEQEILVTVKHKNWTGVEKDICYVEDSYGLDSGYGWLDDVVAWMPLPEPYKEGERNGQE